MPNGEIQPEFVTRLQEIGQWTQKYGDCIYGTRGGPVEPGSWGVTTRKDNKIFVHILDWDAPELALPIPAGRVNSAKVLRDGSKISFSPTHSGILLEVPASQENEIDRIVELDLAPQR